MDRFRQTPISALSRLTLDRYESEYLLSALIVAISDTKLTRWVPFSSL